MRERGTTIAVFRILVSLVTLYSLLSIANANLVDVLWVGHQHGGMIARESGHWIWALLDGPNTGDGSTPGNVWLLYWMALLGAVSALVGFGGWLTMLLTQQCYIALVGLNPHVSGGYDTLISIAWLALTVGGATRTLSVDCYRRTRRWVSGRGVPCWPRWAITIQLLVMYTATGLQKVGLPWTPMGGYSALHYVMLDPNWVRFDASWVQHVEPLLQLGTAVTWHWEQLSLLMLLVLYYRATKDRGGKLRAWFNRWDWRIPWALLGVGLHIGILLLLNVGPFSWISMAYYVTLWSPAELSRLPARVQTLSLARK